MTALTQSKRTSYRRGEIYSRAVKAGVNIFQGAMVCLEDGFAVPARTATNLVADGIAREPVDNSNGADGEQRIDVQPLTTYIENSTGSDAITIADIGSDCFIVDDQTVSKTDGGGTRSVAGKITEVDDSGVLVRFGIDF